MGNIIVGIVLLAVILNAFRMLRKQKKHIYRKDDSAPDE